MTVISFFAGTILGGAYEYICSVFSELVFGTVFWDYSAIPFNLGRPYQSAVLFFLGIVAVVWLKMLYPILSGWIEKLPVKWGKLLSNSLILLWSLIWLSPALLWGGILQDRMKRQP